VAWAPPVQALAVNYFKPLVTPTPVATRLPVPGRTEDTVNRFLRIDLRAGFPPRMRAQMPEKLVLIGYRNSC